MNDLYVKTVDAMRDGYGAELVESYHTKIFDMQSRVGFIGEFAKLTPKMIDNIVSYPWSGAHFSDRLWKHKESFLLSAREIITQGVIQGKSVPAMAKQLSDAMGQTYKNAERVIRTETTHFHNEAEKSAYKAAGVTGYEFMATLDERTCTECGPLDGEHFPLDKAQTAVNYPPIHPNCRCTTIEHDPEDALDWINSGIPMPNNMTWAEWKNQYVDGAGHSV